MAGIVSNIKNNIMLGQADYLFRKGETYKYFNNVKSGKFDIKNDKIKKQLKELIDNLISVKLLAILTYQDKIFLANIYPEYMNFETDPLGLCSVGLEDLMGNQQLIKKFIEDNNLYSSVGKNLEDFLLRPYYSLSDNDKENIFLFMKYLKDHGYKIFDGLSSLDKITEELQRKIVDNDLMNSELADKLWTYSTFGNKKFEILDSIRDMSNSYKFWSSLPNNQSLEMSYFDLFKKYCNEDKECLNSLGMPSEKFLVKLARDKLPYYMHDFQKYFLELMIKDKNEIVIRTFFEDGKLENLFPLNYHNMNNIFSESDIYALDKCKNMYHPIYTYQICKQFIKFYINSENIKSIEDINKLYYEIIKPVFMQGNWNAVIFTDYHDMQEFLSELDICALDKYKNICDTRIGQQFKNLYNNGGNIKTKEDVDKFYKEIIKSAFKNDNWAAVIHTDYRDMQDIFSNIDIYALDKYKGISDSDIKYLFQCLYRNSDNIKNKEDIDKLYKEIIKSAFKSGGWDSVIHTDYRDMQDIFSDIDIYALDKYKNIYYTHIGQQFKKLYNDAGNIKTKEDVDKLYKEIIKSAFKNGNWDSVIHTDYRDMQDIFSDIDIYALDKYQMLDNSTIMITFSHYYVENKISIEKIDLLCDLIKRLNSSSSVELVNFQGAIFNELLKDDDSIKKFEKIEKIFVKNNIPVFVKLFKCFQILYSDLSKCFRFDDNQIVSPELAKLNFNGSNLDRLNKNVLPNDMRLQVIFNDLFRISLGSNNHSLKKYIKNIENGNTLYIGLLSGNISYDGLSSLQKETLDIFIAHLETLIENSKYSLEGDYDRLSALEKIKIIGKNFKITSRYDLPDRIVRHFLYFAGINSFEELKDKMENIVISKDKINQERGRELENGKFTLETGDFIRGVGNEFDLINSLNLGNVCKEYLGSINGTSCSDSTPLDIDLSRITYNGSNDKSIGNTPSGSGYGNYYIVIKRDNPNMTISRDSNGDKNVLYDPSKFEMFKTLADNHYGVRTGISSTDIDYIMINGDYDISKLKFEIAKNGFYIPVVNVDGNLLYTVDEYNNLKEKMKGLSYYDVEEYTLSTEHLYFPGIEEIIADMHEDREKQIQKRKALQTTISNIISSSGLGIDKINMSPTPDLSNNNADLIEIGSTSRGTNVPNDSDYDFILKVGKQQVLENSNAILSKFNEYFKPKENNSHTNRFRGSNINIEGFDLPVDIDISIDQKRNSEIYFSDTSLQDRLGNIERQYPKDYEAVLANIVYAKELLKKEGCYKPHKSDSSQSGLGGIGVENWILQNGGSFYSAAKSFYDASVDKSFDEFKKVYKVWDFGQNHEPREKNGIIYPFDEYVSDNMAENGYQKMREVCKKYLDFVKSGKLDLVENEQLENDISIKR